MILLTASFVGWMVVWVLAWTYLCAWLVKTENEEDEVRIVHA